MLDPDFWLCWKTFARLIPQFEFNYLPVDHPRREEFLAKIEDKVERKFEVDWNEKVGFAAGGNFGPPPEIDLSFMYAIPIVRELYA